jgi:hypothetical protein
MWLQSCWSSQRRSDPSALVDLQTVGTARMMVFSRSASAGESPAASRLATAPDSALGTCSTTLTIKLLEVLVRLESATHRGYSAGAAENLSGTSNRPRRDHRLALPERQAVVNDHTLVLNWTHLPPLVAWT